MTAADGTDSSAAGASIVVVDDEPAVRDTLRRMLERLGYAVVAVDTGKAALEACSTSPPDLLITDVLMPDFDGFELISAVRSGGSAIPVIAMSGGGSGSARHYLAMASRLGAVSVLEKPVTLDTLAGAVRDALGAPS